MASPKPEKLRNFCIIAHIDHGKSTLADRMLELTGVIDNSGRVAQVLDSMDIERERGITIKAQAVAMDYNHSDGETYRLNLIDTPGHVDFSYEVSRSLAACEAAIVLIDATQGIEAQTIANVYMAIEHDLVLIPVLNKIDLESARPVEMTQQIVDLIGCSPEEVMIVSAKNGTGVKDLLENLVKLVPTPTPDRDKPLQALIFDSLFDNYRGAIAYIRVVSGIVKPGMQIFFHHTGNKFLVDEVGHLRLGRIKADQLVAGEVGYIVPGCKDVSETRVGDTIGDIKEPLADPLPGYRVPHPMVFSGLFPADAGDYEELRDAINRLKLNDASLFFEPETSTALGFGFRCGFLGLLHLEIVQERLEREYNLNLVSTVPNVEYKVLATDGKETMVDNPANLPPLHMINRIEEPIVKAQIVTPPEFIGAIMKLTTERRGVYETTEYLDSERAVLHYRLPLAEIIYDFYDRLKSMSRGYASLDYEITSWEPTKTVRLDILINGEQVDALSVIVHEDKAYTWGRRVVDKLSKIIPRQMFEVAIQAAINSQIIARATVRAMRKNVTAKCYGGDITRKRKLLEKQKEGKKRMKRIGHVDLPQEAFMSILKAD
ncbi:MAG: elongation factor 4 [Calditrichaeota bacterium]|jgi:GTP-binding protein LepA|nr:elongation factor 4 [Calditrichota bacterium]MBT7618911.1 elongation factor 4 [Calditrichota bacterium]MBT7789127.1 elongation factor 4 [Calditrichota bacterium]